MDLTKPIADISYWQGRNIADSPADPGIDFDKLIANTAGVICRAGDGLIEDRRFKQYVAGLGSHLIGAYWFTREDIDPVRQANKFADVVSGVDFARVQLVGGDLPALWMDAEDNSAGKTKAALSVHYAKFIETLEMRNSRKIGVYTRASFWNYHVGNAGWEDQFPLWVAHYTTREPLIPDAWDKYHLHQHSADKNGRGAEFGVLSTDIDLNRIHPDLIPKVIEPPVVIEPHTCPNLGQLRARYNLAIRVEPSTSGVKVGTLAKGEIVDALKIHPQNAAVVWVKHAQGWSAVTYFGALMMEAV